MLENYLGHEWSTAWAQAVRERFWQKIPDTFEARFNLLGVLKTYFDAHTAQQVASLKVTADEAAERLAACSAARNDLLLAMSALGEAEHERGGGSKPCARCVAYLVNELTVLLARTTRAGTVSG